MREDGEYVIVVGVVTPRQAAEELGVSRATIYRAIRRGELTAVRLGERGALRIGEASLARFLKPATGAREGLGGSASSHGADQDPLERTTSA